MAHSLMDLAELRAVMEEHGTAWTALASRGLASTLPSALAAPAIVVAAIEPMRIRVRHVVSDADAGDPLRVHVPAVEIG